MDTRLRTALVVIASTIAGAAVTAWAEPTLRYNYDYVCTRGLRIVVGHCRHDSDMPGVAPTTPENDYCQVYYPDRGSDAKEMVLRDHLIESLEACGAFGATTSGSNAKQNTAAAASSGRPPSAAMPIGPALCPLLRRLEGLAREDFRSIELGPDREFGKRAAEVSRTSMAIPGAKCYIDHGPDQPITYTCMWPQCKEVEDQFVNMVKALEKCTGGTADLSNVTEYEIADVTMNLRGVEYHTAVINDFLSLDVHMAKP